MKHVTEQKRLSWTTPIRITLSVVDDPIHQMLVSFSAAYSSALWSPILSIGRPRMCYGKDFPSG